MGNGFRPAVRRLRPVAHFVTVVGVVGLTAGALAIASGQPALGATRGSPLSRASWQRDISHAGSPGRGCYKAAYPALNWQATTCKVAPEIPFAPASASRPASAFPTLSVGDGADYSAVVSGTISSATGSFDDVSPGITEVGQYGGTGTQYATTYSLQLNTQFISGSPACSGAADPSACLAWQQFVYDSYGNEIFMQYWLIDYDTTCPSTWYTYSTDCYTNSTATTFPSRISAADLATTQLTGTASSGGNDEETLSFGGQAVMVANADSKIHLASYWNTTEFNVFGDGGGGQATFGAGTTLEAQTTLTDSSASSAPTCTVEGFTAETNNLTLTATPAIAAQTSPTMVFEQTNTASTTPSCSTSGASKLAVTTQPTSTAVNQAFTVGVSIEKESGTVLTTRTTTVHLAISAGTTGATLTCTGATTDKKDATAGVATFSCKLSAAHTGYKLKATSGALAAVTTTAFTITTNTASKLAITTQPASTTVSQAFTVGVSIENSSGTVLTTKTTTVQLAISAGTTGATLTCTGATTDKKDASSGVASFSCKIATAHTGYKIQATSGSLTAATTHAFTITNPTTPTKLAITTQPASTTVNQSFTVGVSIENAAGTVLTSQTTTVQLAISAGTVGATLTCTGATTDKKGASSGVASFSCKIGTAHTGYKVQATSGSLTSATTHAFTISPPAPTKLTFTTEPSTAELGASFTTKVSVEDATGILTTNTSDVTLSIESGTAGATLTCTGGATHAAVAGVASFSCSLSKPGASYELHAADGGISTTSSTFAITPTPSKLVFTTEPPASRSVGSSFTTAVSVRNPLTATDTTNTSTVTLTLTGGSAGATLTCSGTDSHAAVAGVATFSCSISEAGTAYRLTATDSGLTGATSTPIDITSSSGGGGGGGTTTTSTPTPPKAPTGTRTTKSGRSTTPTGKLTVTDSPIGFTVTATGAGALTIGAYTSNPTSTTLAIATGKYLDVEIASGSKFTSVTLKVCSVGTGTALGWWNGTAWVPFSDVTRGATGCITATVTSSTDPSLADLTGTPVGVERPSARIYGATADATAAAELEEAFSGAGATSCAGGIAHSVVLARDSGYADALSSQDLARFLGTGTLLTPTTELSQATLAALRKEGIQKVYIVGGPLAVDTTVVDTLESTPAYNCGGSALAENGTGVQTYISVVRIYGATAYGTAEAVAKFVGSAPTLSFPGAYSGTNTTGGTGQFNDTAAEGSAAPATGLPTAILATGTTWMDAESASALAYADGIPILLTTPASLPATTATALTTLGIKQVIVMGGPLAVTDTVSKELEATFGISVLRIAGKDYTDTAVELASFELSSSGVGLGWAPEGTVVLVARGDFYTDGLCGAVLERDGATSEAPLLLTENPTVAGVYLTAFLRVAGSTGTGIGTGHKKVAGLTVLGGPLAVSTTVVAQMRTALQH